MIDRWIEQLNASDPELRREAIVALGRSKNPDALHYLAAIFRTDPEPELRELARKAGAYIQQQQNAAPTPPPPAQTNQSAARRRAVIREIAPTDEDDAPPRDSERGGSLLDEPAQEKTQRGPQRGREYNVSKANRDTARKLVDAAMTLNLNGDNAKALKSLTQALRTDPNLINDNFFNSLAATITGKEGDEAIQVIVDGDQRAQAMKAAQKEKRQKRVDKHMEAVKASTGRSVGFEMLIYLLTSVFGPVIVMLVFIQSSLRFLEESVGLTGDPTAEAEISRAIREGAEMLSLNGVTLYLITALVSGVLGLIGFLIQAGVIHVVARNLLGGTGTFNHLMATLLAFYNKWLPIYFVASSIFTGLFFVLFPSPILICFVLPIVLLTFYIMFKTLGKIGEAYDIGLPMGCVAYLIASIVLAALGAVLSAVLRSALASSVLQTPL
jgi:hypothetical protein